MDAEYARQLIELIDSQIKLVKMLSASISNDAANTNAKAKEYRQQKA
jgi:hypothetical protein